MGNKSKYDLKTAKDLYMVFKPLNDISKELNIPYKTLVYHTSKWKEERGLIRNEILKELSENKKTILSSLVGNSLECVDRAILDLRNRTSPPSISEARMLTNIIAEIDKILRLDDDKPTDIIAEHKPATVIELREKLKRDPFYIEDTIPLREIDYDKEAEEFITTTITTDASSSNDGDTSRDTLPQKDD